MQIRAPGWPTTRARKRVALLLDYMTFTSGAYEAVLRKAFHTQAVERDLDLLMVYGRALDDSDPEAMAHNAIFDLLSPACVDGVIVVATSLSARCGTAGLRKFVERLQPLPVCSLGVEVPGVPTVAIDNYAPMRSLVEHLIERHGKRRIAFLGGTPGNREGDARFAAYRDALSAHGLTYDEELVASGEFLTWSARIAMQRIVDRTRDFDAVVAANDNMAVGAVETLWRNGIHVPSDVAVTGFDDLAWASFGNPPLSTVAQPLEATAGRAFDVLLSTLAGEETGAVINLPTEVVLRRSCGCGRPVAPGDPADARTPAEFVTAFAEQIQENLEERLRREGLGRSFAPSMLVEPLRLELTERPGAFMAALDRLLEPLSADIERCRVCQESLKFLREWLRPVATRELDDLFFEAFDRVAVSLAGTQVGHQLNTDRRYLELISASERVSVALDEPSLCEALAVSLPALGVKNAFVSVLDDQQGTSLLRPLICLRAGEVQEAVDAYDARQLVPTGGCPFGQRHTLAVFPLTIDAKLQGLVAFGYERDAHGYSPVRDNICAALRSIRLHEELVARTRLHERSLQERQATTKRIQSLSVLAGGVAHDLNNALGPLVALPELILQRLEGGSVDDLPKSRQDLQTIQTAAQRAVQTIRDLLTLGRQGRVQKEQLDLGRTVASAVLYGGSAAGAGTETRISLEAAREPLPVTASEAHLVRAISNLIQNAVEAQRGGTVVVRTERLQLEEPLHAYEIVEPGEYGVVRVSDQGSGIPEDGLPRVFEPFFSTKKLGERSGSGLGLAIVHGVTKEHGGFVDVTSTAGEGTTFSLYFPLVKPLARSDRPRSPSLRAHARVLVLDDDPVQCRTAERILEHVGCSVQVVTTGAEAYDLCLASAQPGGCPYDLLIFDVVLGEAVDGVEWYERIRSHLPQQRVLLVSGHMPSSRVERAVENGLGWLAKPYTADALSEAVWRTLAGDAPRNDALELERRVG